MSLDVSFKKSMCQICKKYISYLLLFDISFKY